MFMTDLTKGNENREGCPFPLGILLFDPIFLFINCVANSQNFFLCVKSTAKSSHVTTDICSEQRNKI